jgi:hypothetical protein
MYVLTGFIVGFDSEKASVADAMIDCIEATSIPVCMIGPLYSLPNTQLNRRLEREGRVFQLAHTDAHAPAGDSRVLDDAPSSGVACHPSGELCSART